MRFPWRRRPEELREELESHLDMAARDRMDRGESSAEANAAAHREFGNPAIIREVTHDQWGWSWLENLLQDLRFGLRMLRKSPGFTAVAVLTLALGIGANTAILAVMNAVYRPKLPYLHPEQLVDAYNKNLNVAWDYAEFVSIPLWRDWQERNHSFDHIAAFSWSRYLNLSGVGEAGRIRAAKVSPDIFAVLGLQPVLGRDFREDEDAPGRDHVAILSYRLWITRFSRRSDVVGQTIHLSREDYTVIGVLPENFQLSTLTDRVDVLTPLDLVGPDSARRDVRSVIAIGRLRPNVSLTAAQADLSAISAQAAKSYPATDGGWGANLISVRDDLLPFGRSQFMIFLGLVSLVLLAACLNIAVLSLAKTESRRQEYVIRSVLGAGRGRLLRQTLCETGLLAVAGTLGALLFASWGTQLLLRYTPAEFLNNVSAAPLDFSVLAAVAGMCLATVIVVALLPAISSISPNRGRGLAHDGPRVARSPRGYVLLIGAEIAIGLALVVAAGVLARSLQAISRLDAGLDPRNIVSSRITLDPTAYPGNASRTAFFDRFIADLQGRSGLDVTAGSALPLDDVGWLDNAVSVPDAKSTNTSADNLPSCSSVFVYPGYFGVLGTPILMGRDFTASESDPVVVINEAFAREFFPGQNPIGKLVVFSPNVNAAYNGASTGVRRVIGVVKDFRDNALRYNAPTFATAFFSYRQNPTPSLNIIVKSSRAAGAIALLRQEVAQLDPAEPLYGVQSMSKQWQKALGSWRFHAWLGALVAAMALFLSAIGVYGVISHSVKLRTREIGIRVALGSQPRQIVFAMMKRVSRAIAVGIACGLLAAFALTRQLSSLLFQVTPFDLGTFVFGALLLTAVAVLASYIPARRAMKVDPMVALRYE